MHKHSSHCTRGLTMEERLLHYLPDRPEEECWIWQGTTNRRGYGVLNIGKKQHRAHRAAYETWIGPIPEGLTLDHVKARGCTSTLCCNPAHLEPVTAGENSLRGDCPRAINARKEQCLRGHDFDLVRVIDGKEYRDCSECRRIRQKKYRSKTGLIR